MHPNQFPNGITTAIIMFDESIELPIIPQPSRLIRYDGVFRISQTTVLVGNEPDLKIMTRLQKLLGFRQETSSCIIFGAQSSNNTIRVILDRNVMSIKNDEEYVLSVTPTEIQLLARSSTGLLYAFQTFRQILPAALEGDNQYLKSQDIIIPCVYIQDSPRFKWRGYLLDESRIFYGKRTVLEILDLMELHKLNVFHWHLTDDQGWRVEIPKYRLLTDIGAWRNEPRLRWLAKRDGRYGGYYTGAEIREIVAYASERHITVIPEIDMPGHSRAAISAYSHLGCPNRRVDVGQRAGIYAEVLCAGRETTYTFVLDVIDEICSLFPSPYVHIGGDEVVKWHWRGCKDCQSRLSQNSLKSSGDLLTYFMNRIAKHLAQNGRQAILWNDAVDDNLNEDVVIQYWFPYNKKEMLKQITQGRQIIISDVCNLYLNWRHILLPLKKVYKFNPMLFGLSGDQYSSILGVEAALWTDYLPAKASAHQQTFPRLSAVAEISWSPAHLHNYNLFRRRLAILLTRLNVMKIDYTPEEIVDRSGILKEMLRKAVEFIVL